MLRMISYSRRLKSGQITCYLNRTYHVLLTERSYSVAKLSTLCYCSLSSSPGWNSHLSSVARVSCTNSGQSYGTFRPCKILSRQPRTEGLDLSGLAARVTSFGSVSSADNHL